MSKPSPNRDQPEHTKHHTRPGKQRLEMEAPKQANLQFVDDTWERLLNAMERLEQVTEQFKSISASRLDRHIDKDHIQEDELDIRSEVHLQIKALQRVTHPVREEVSWLIEDFLAWFGAREPRQLATTDDYALPILQCIRGVPYVLPDLPESGPLTQQDMMRTVEALGAGLHASDKIVETYVQNPDQQASRNPHLRGTVAQGVNRLQRFSTPWIKNFLSQLSKQPEFNQTPMPAADNQDTPPDQQPTQPASQASDSAGGQLPADGAGDTDGRNINQESL
jgi:hypothetical protein